MTATQNQTVDQLLATEALAAWRRRQAGNTEPEMEIGIGTCPVCGDGMVKAQVHLRNQRTEDGLLIAAGQLWCPMRDYATCTFEPREWDVTVNRQGGYIIANVNIEGAMGALVDIWDDALWEVLS